MKVLIATQKPFAAVAVEGIKKILTEAGHEVVLFEKYAEQADFVAAVADAEALIIRSDKVTAEVIAAAPKLKIVVRAGAGYDNVDLEAASARKIVVMNTPGQNSNAVAELAVALMIFMARTQFTPATGSEIQGKTLGIQAFGAVGRLVGAKAKALGMKVKALDPFLTDDQIAAGGAEPVHTLDELYSGSDYVSLHIPALPSTIGSINYELITKMPKGATLVNTARKEVIDEAGLETGPQVRHRRRPRQPCSSSGKVRSSRVRNSQEDGSADLRSQYQRRPRRRPSDRGFLCYRKR